jgi:nitric oxide reductase NorQ protein
MATRRGIRHDWAARDGASACDESNMDLRDYLIEGEPYYRAVGEEARLFEAAFANRMPMMLKGPTGCGKTRFVESMAWRLGKPLVTVACHEDMTASDLVGRFLLDAQGTVWHDGPLTVAVRHGAICYLDEIVEARQDTTVVIHPLTDDRRILPLEKKGELVHAHPDFQLVISYNPGYQSVLKDLKESTKQRFGAIDFGYPAPDIEAEIVAHEAGIDEAAARTLVSIGQRSRNLKGHGLDEGASTRMLIQAGRLVARGIAIEAACQVALVLPITDDVDIRGALTAAIAVCV